MTVLTEKQGKKPRSRTDFCRQVIDVLYKRRTVPQAVHVYVTSLIMF